MCAVWRLTRPILYKAEKNVIIFHWKTKSSLSVSVSDKFTKSFLFVQILEIL